LPLDVHASVENPEYRDASLVHDQICNPVVTIGGFANLSITNWLIPLPESWMRAKELRLGINARHNFTSRSRVVAREVLVDFFQAPHCLERPRYFRRESITSATSSSLCVRAEAASSSPR
jgi:hypothetical protein